MKVTHGSLIFPNSNKTDKPFFCKTLFLLGTVILGILTQVQAEDGFYSLGYASGGATYLNRPSNASSSALSGAVSAWSSNVFGMHYNPALLDGANEPYLSGAFQILTDDRSFGVAEGALPIGSYLVLGASLWRLSVGDIEKRDIYGTFEQSFEEKETALALYVAGRTQWNLALGVAARFLHQSFESIDDGTAAGV